MLNRFYLIGFAFVALPIIFILSSKLVLTFFILFPVMLFPYFYPTHDRHPLLDKIFLVITGFLFIFFLTVHFSWEILILGIFQGLLGISFYLYRRIWQQQLLKETVSRDQLAKELDAFNRKYDSRITSLQHLEKQVMGLLDLFEVSRDFSEYLSFQGVTDILSKRVRPLFPFKTLELLLLYEKPVDTSENFIRYRINEQGIAESTDPLTSKEVGAFDKLKNSKSVLHQETQWLFPLLFDDALSSILIVDGAHPDDLAKYEVLSAFLTLQVSKIRLYNSVKELAIRDSLTHVFVRRHFLERLEEELRRSVKFSIPLAVLMLDIDHFKRYNDEYGHIAGDATLQQVSEILIQSLRKVDIVGRYGGEEFVVAIPETRQDGALEICERIRSNIARNVFKIYNTETRVTVSIGVSLFIPESLNKDDSFDYSKLAFDLMQNADKALYRAKEEGRNQVVLFEAGK